MIKTHATIAAIGGLLALGAAGFATPTFAADKPSLEKCFGVAKAGNDAEALAKALAGHDDIDTALKIYNAERQPIGNTIVMHSRKLGTHMGVDLKTDEDRRMHALLQSDEAMMDWIAVPNFLDTYQ